MSEIWNISSKKEYRPNEKLDEIWNVSSQLGVDQFDEPRGFSSLSLNSNGDQARYGNGYSLFNSDGLPPPVSSTYNG